MSLDNVSISPNPHLPPHLREICDILARGLLRLRSRGAPAETTETAERRDIPLHFTAHQRRHAPHERKGTA
jgi:hypothetical protein